MFTLSGKRTEIGLGGVTDVPLALAREKAAEQRQLLKAGLDPLQEKRRKERGHKLKAAKSMTFAECARAYIDANRSGWSNPKHAQQWNNTLEQYAFPIFGDLPIADMDTALVSKCLQQIWNSKNERRVDYEAESNQFWIGVLFTNFAKARTWRGEEVI